MKYSVQVPCVYRETFSVEADSPEEAIQKVDLAMDGELTFDYALEKDEWKVFEIKDAEVQEVQLDG